MSMNNCQKLLNVKDLQSLIGCGRNKVYQLLSSKTLPSIQIGKQYYVPIEEYNKWVNRNLNDKILL